MDDKEKSNSGLVLALKVHALCFLYLFSCKALSEIVQGLVESSCFREGTAGGGTLYIGGVILCANMCKNIA